MWLMTAASTPVCVFDRWRPILRRDGIRHLRRLVEPAQRRCQRRCRPALLPLPSEELGLDTDYWEPPRSDQPRSGRSDCGCRLRLGTGSLGGDDNYMSTPTSAPACPDSSDSNRYLGYTDGVLAPPLLAGDTDDSGLDWSIGASYAAGPLEVGISYIGVEGPSIDGFTDSQFLKRGFTPTDRGASFRTAPFSWSGCILSMSHDPISSLHDPRHRSRRHCRIFELIGLKEVRRKDSEQGRFTPVPAAPGEEGVAEVELTYNWPPEDSAGGAIRRRPQLRTSRLRGR